jgi:hypothetical protein
MVLIFDRSGNGRPRPFSETLQLISKNLDRRVYDRSRLRQQNRPATPLDSAARFSKAPQVGSGYRLVQQCRRQRTDRSARNQADKLCPQRSPSVSASFSVQRRPNVQQLVINNLYRFSYYPFDSYLPDNRANGANRLGLHL